MPSQPPLPATMRAWHLTAFNTPYTLTAATPLPRLSKPTDMLIRVLAASYCHTDAVVAAGLVPRSPPLPHIGCHEFAGEVVALGPEASASWKIGDRVAVPGRGNHVCGACLECNSDSAVNPDPRGFSVYCPAAGAGLGVDRPGGFAEYAVVDARQVGAIPEGLGCAEVAPLMCAGLTVFAAIRKLGLKKGQRVAVMGAGGGLGHLGCQFASKMGLRVLALDVKGEALELVKGLGLEGVRVVDARDTKAEEVRRELGAEDGRLFFEQMGVDAAIVLPESQTAFDYAMALVRNGGKMMVLSFPPEGFHFSAVDLVLRRVSIEGSLIGSNNAMRQMFVFCVEHGVRARIQRYPFEKLDELVEDYHRGKPGKLVLDSEMVA